MLPKYPANVRPLLARDAAIDIFLAPGEHFVGGAGFRVRTLLGSCVSIILWHPGKRVGAMSHFLLPARAHGQREALDGRYGDEALTLMCDELRALGASPAGCEARIAGGGDMFPDTQPGRQEPRIGYQNGAAARRLLAERNIAVRAEHLFGRGHRQVVFDLTEGRVWVRHAHPQEDAASVGGAAR